MKKKQKYVKRVIMFLFLVFIFSCLKPKFIVDDFSQRKPKTVAILPLENMTNDIQIVNVVRQLLAEKLPRRYFNVMPVEQTDQILRDEFEITLGEQLKLVEISQLAEKIKVDGFFMGIVEKAETVVTGIYNKKKVKVDIYLIDARTGEKLWEDEREAGETTIALSPKEMLKQAATAVADSALSQLITGHPLYKYANQAVSTIVSTIPK